MLIRLASLLPLWTFVILSLVAGNFSGPMFSKPPDILGIPLGVVIAMLVGGWMLIGVALIWDAGSRARELLGLVLFTAPATVMLVFMPAVILIMQNLG